MPRVQTFKLCCDHPAHNGREVEGEACRIEIGDRSANLILCAQHRGALEDLAALGTPGVPRSGRGRRRRVPLEELIRDHKVGF